MALAHQVFTLAGSYVAWTWPVGVTEATAECLGAGGAGGAAQGNPSTGGGGRGGSYAKKTFTRAETTAQLNILAGSSGMRSEVILIPSSAVVCLAPAGGVGATTASNSANGAGATTSSGTPVGDVIYDGGNGGTGNFTAGVGGSGAGGSAAGPAGVGGNATGNTAGTAGPGTFLNGIAYQSAGAAGVGNSTVGATAGVYGGGGSGGKANTNTDRAGGLGAQGIVLLTWTTVDPTPQMCRLIV